MTTGTDPARSSSVNARPEIGVTWYVLKKPGVTVLVEGSRVNRLERVVERLVAPLPAVGNGN